MKELRKTKRTTLVRVPKKASYDRKAAYAILDEALVAHIGIIDEGTPVVIPRNHWRVGDTLYFHSSNASRTTRAMVRPDSECCVEVSITDGLVFARSPYSLSVNARSFIGFGQAFLVEDVDEKTRLLEALVERIAPGRWAAGPTPEPKLLKATAVIGFPLDEASVKIRSGPPDEKEGFEDLPLWVGVLPLAETAGTPEPAPEQDPDVPPPDYLLNWRQPF
jgi:uncharacterized protein